MSAVRYRTVHKTIHPPEADTVANQMQQAMGTAALLKSRFLSIRSNLEAEWEGEQRKVFSSACQQLEARINNYSDLLRGIEQGYRGRTVTIETTEPIP